MASVTVTQVRALGPSNTYVVTTTVNSAVGMPTELFVFKSTGEYSHVATLTDLSSFPASPQPGVGFYRSAVVSQSLPDVTTATEVAETHKARIQTLVTDYTVFADTFAGTETITISG